MTSANISDPFVISSYTSSSRAKSKNAPGIYATSYSKSNTSDGFITVAAQADGLHIVDVSALHPVVSHTLGPSTSFACPPVTLPSASAGSSTYAVISASSQLSSPEDAGRAIWMWNDDVKDAKQVKQSKALFSKDQTVQGLYSCKALPRRIAAVSSTGHVSLVDAESLDVKASFAGDAAVVGAYIFSSNSATFVNGEDGAVLVLCQAGKSKTTHLRILAIDEADSILQKYEWDLPVDSKKITSISCSDAGTLSVLTSDGTLSAFILSSQEPRPLSPLRISGFSSSAISLLALTSSHVLLAGITSHDITLLLWDLQFSVLLASHTLSIPSALTAASLQVRLVPGTQVTTKAQDSARGNVFLVLASDSAEDKTASVLLAIPYAVPAVSTIAAAMGKGAAGKKWLQSAETKQQVKTKQTSEEVARVNLLETMRTAMQGGRPQAATAAFMKWAPKADSAAKEGLDYNFVKEILNVILAPPTAESPLTATPEITQYLLQKRIVSSAMIASPGGLLGALRARGDWKSIEMAFDTVVDLTEAEMVDCLRVVVAQHQRASATSDDAMDVDESAAAAGKASSGNTVPSLPAFLNLVASYATSRGPLLAALRRYLQDADELTSILQVLSGWLRQKSLVDEHLMPTNKELKKSEQGVWVVVGRKGDKNKKKEIPPLQKIVELVQTILDASFLALLQHPASYKVLRTLNSQLSPEIEFADATESLRGSLEPFAMAQQKAVKESLIPPQERERERQKGDWRQRRKGPGAAPGVAPDIGVYRLEELYL